MNSIVLYHSKFNALQILSFWKLENSNMLETWISLGWEVVGVL